MINQIFVFSISEKTTVCQVPSLSQSEQTRLVDYLLSNIDPKQLIKEERRNFEFENFECFLQKFDQEIIIGAKTKNSSRKKRFLYKIFDKIYEKMSGNKNLNFQSTEFVEFVESLINEFNSGNSEISIRNSSFAKDNQLPFSLETIIAKNNQRTNLVGESEKVVDEQIPEVRVEPNRKAQEAQVSLTRNPQNDVSFLKTVSEPKNPFLQSENEINNEANKNAANSQPENFEPVKQKPKTFEPNIKEIKVYPKKIILKNNQENELESKFGEKTTQASTSKENDDRVSKMYEIDFEEEDQSGRDSNIKTSNQLIFTENSKETKTNAVQTGINNKSESTGKKYPKHKKPNIDFDKLEISYDKKDHSKPYSNLKNDKKQNFEKNHCWGLIILGIIAFLIIIGIRLFLPHNTSKHDMKTKVWI